MTDHMKFKQFIIFSFLMIPYIGFSQNSGELTNVLGKLFVGIILAVVIGALLVIYNLSSSLLDLQLERAGKKRVKKSTSYWKTFKEKLTRAVPIEKESDILLDHNYDGIKELDNRLPPWWLYGFYFTIIYGIIYLGYYHYYEVGLSSGEEYEQEVLRAEIAVDRYLERQANTIDESNLVALTDDKSLVSGSKIFNRNCITCHLKGGGGSSTSIGPNLTDEYWLHGGDIKSIFRTVKYGVPDKGMIAWKAQLKPSDMHKVSSYILSLQGTNPINAKAPQGDKFIPSEEESAAN